MNGMPHRPTEDQFIEFCSKQVKEILPDILRESPSETRKFVDGLSFDEKTALARLLVATYTQAFVTSSQCDHSLIHLCEKNSP